jgi:hypothetical protein
LAIGTEASRVTDVMVDGPVLTPAHDRPCVGFIVHGESVMASPSESDPMSSAFAGEFDYLPRSGAEHSW